MVRPARGSLFPREWQLFPREYQETAFSIPRPAEWVSLQLGDALGDPLAVRLPPNSTHAAGDDGHVDESLEHEDRAISLVDEALRVPSEQELPLVGARILDTDASAELPHIDTDETIGTERVRDVDTFIVVDDAM